MSYAHKLACEASFPLIDAHIHLDHYDEVTRERLIQELPACRVQAVIAVSMHLASSKVNLALAERYPSLIFPAFGFHPEQPLPTDEEMNKLLGWIRGHADSMVAVGEIGLPYYARKEAEEQGASFELEPYLALLDKLFALARELDKPVALHAVYEDADLVCDLLEQHGLSRAHFHWFKGASSTTRRMAERGYYVSFTPDLLYESEIQDLARRYPTDRVMTETDGPWPFEGPFAGRITHPAMTAEVAAAWAHIQGLSPEEAAGALCHNARSFYGI
ncbi:TatD family hydrolase [Paenibacillus sanguinis]|uniref:TatD family hydrolase n=1 Tax=Paenibacillus sanguinis TaxID=225906 RepID=UPI00035E2A92|nr:TatD family hydrolase [Paenibacillus sanguinis]